MTSGKRGWHIAKEKLIQLKLDILLTEAAILFNQKGYSATSLDEIAEKLSITKTAIYHYVKNKNDLLYQCYLRSIESTEQCYKKADVTGVTGLQKMVHYLQLDAESGPVTMTPLTELDSLKDTDIRKEFEERLKTCEAIFIGFIEEGIKDGSITDCDPELTMKFILGSSRWMMKWYSPDDGRDLPEIVGLFLQFILNGLVPRKENG